MIIKNQTELNQVKTAAKINTEALLRAKDLVRLGISSYEVDKKTEEFYKSQKVLPAFKGVPGKKFPYPATINFQINDQVVHNIPSETQIVQSGDIISIDTGCIYQGIYADQATSFGVREISEEDARLLEVGLESILAGCKMAIAGNKTGDIGQAQQSVIEGAGFSVVKVLCGHEIGRNLWENLKIPAYGKAGTGDTLPENMVICIENQTCAGTDEVYTGDDGWVISTTDGKNAVTFEHMVIVRKDKAEVITRI